jgi:ATP-binding cassette subfamily B (MDR/TAP) protein 1
VPFRQLFRYATGADMLLNTFAAVAATGNGFIFPGFALLFGDLLSQFNTVTSTDEFVAKINRYALWFLLIAIGAGVTALLENALPMITAERQIRRVREAYVNALLRQEVAFYDTNKAGELASRMIEDTLTMSGGIAEKSFASIHYSITFLGGIAVGFARSWQLTLVMFGALPVIMVVMAFLTNSVRKVRVTVGRLGRVAWPVKPAPPCLQVSQRIQQDSASLPAFTIYFSVVPTLPRCPLQFSSNEANAYAKAGDAATEAFSAIRTVAAFGAEEHEVERYDSHLAVAEKNGASKGVWVGGAVGAIFGCIFIFYGLSSLVAGVLIIRDRDANPACYDPNTPGCFTGGDVVATLMAVLIGSFSLGQVGPNFSAFASAQVAAYKLYAIIDRVPPIDVQSPAGAKPAPASLAGAIEFRNVTFAYPSRKTEPVLRNFSLSIRGGTTVALVGESGCGKSTLMQLFQRFYDVDEGEVLVDGINVKEWNLAHLRERVGVVSQEPTLFGTSVGENIGYGKPASAGPATQAEIEAAATAANAHEFISRLPEGYSTVVGTSVSSTQLSGGQRQRVCIARAILRDPKYLLLDEATSALDTKSERQVEAALAKLLSRDAVTGVRGTRTTLLIAHRLSTVTNADRIVVMHRGEVIEDGNHVSLMGLEGGAYRRLRELQDMAAEAAAASLAAGTDFAGPSSPRTPAAAAGTGVVVAPAPEHVRVSVASTTAATPSAGSATSATVMTPAARAPAGAVTVPVDSDPTPTAPIAADGLTLQRAPSIRTDAAVLGKGTVAAAAAAAPASGADAAKGGNAAVAKPAAAGAPAAPKEDKEWEREKAKLPPVKLSRVWALQAPEWAYLAIGLLGATLSGITQPVFAIIWSNMIAFFFGPNEQLKDNTRIYVLWFFLLGIAQVVVTIMRIGGFVYAGEKLTRRLRAMAYRAILRQEIGFFEEKGNSVGRLSTRLQADAAEVKGATGEGLSLVFQAGAAVIAGIVIAFQANWRLALVVVAIMPFMVLASLVQGAAFKGYNHGAAKALEESGHIAVESTAAIKTVTAFNLQPQLLQAFSRSLEVPMRAGFGKADSVGLGQLFQGFMMVRGDAGMLTRILLQPAVAMWPHGPCAECVIHAPLRLGVAACCMCSSVRIDCAALRRPHCITLTTPSHSVLCPHSPSSPISLRSSPPTPSPSTRAGSSSPRTGAPSRSSCASTSVREAPQRHEMPSLRHALLAYMFFSFCTCGHVDNPVILLLVACGFMPHASLPPRPHVQPSRCQHKRPATVSHTRGSGLGLCFTDQRKAAGSLRPVGLICCRELAPSKRPRAPLPRCVCSHQLGAVHGQGGARDALRVRAAGPQERGGPHDQGGRCPARRPARSGPCGAQERDLRVPDPPRHARHPEP